LRFAQTGSISKGALQCHLAIAAVSKRIAELEKYGWHQSVLSPCIRRNVDAIRSRNAASRANLATGHRTHGMLSWMILQKALLVM